MSKHIISDQDSAIGIIWANALAPGKAVWRGTKDGRIIDAHGNTIGSYHRYVSGGGWSIHTKAYGGFAYDGELEIVSGVA